MSTFAYHIKDIQKNSQQGEKPFLVVRVYTERYFTKNNDAIVFSKKVRLMKSLCHGKLTDIFCDLEYDYIDNLHTVDDGLYRIEYSGLERDFETGEYDWDFLILKPYSKQQ